MSRHLMARFRLAAEEYDWQSGRPLAWHNFVPPGTWACKRKECRDIYKPENFYSAIVHHGEELYGLAAMPKCRHKNEGKGWWSWGIHKYAGGDHWHGPGEWSEWKRPARYYGRTSSLEGAIRAAERDWRTWTGSQTAERDRNFQLGIGEAESRNDTGPRRKRKSDSGDDGSFFL